ncbi:MAG TPA: ATP-binding protein, partial [Terriglobia bacterium]|nr:ATP-binding protein [Terriglobia bacterium]
ACSEIRKDIGDNYADAGSAPYDSRAHREQFIQQYEQRIQEANLRLSQRRFHLLVESLPCLIFHLDHEQRFRFCNAAYRDYDAMRPGIVRAFLGEEVTCELNLRRQMDRHFYCKFVPERNNVSVIGIFIMLTNAIKFTPDGERIKVAVSNMKSRVVVQVSDNGKGISKDFLPHIVQPFQQADMSSPGLQVVWGWDWRFRIAS